MKYKTLLWASFHINVTKFCKPLVVHGVHGVVSIPEGHGEEWQNYILVYTKYLNPFAATRTGTCPTHTFIDVLASSLLTYNFSTLFTTLLRYLTKE